MEKTDLKKTLDAYRASRDNFRVIDVPAMQYLMVDGHGDPNTAPVFTDAVKALYPVAYALKFASKHELGRDYVVPPLEGLWWADDMESFTAARDKSQWDWTLMLMVPEWLGRDEFSAAIKKVGAKGSPPTMLDDIRLGSLEEGECVQALHVGTFDDEAELLRRMHDEFIPENGLLLTGRHHEIYLSDSRRVAPEKLRTIVRQPVSRR